MTSSHIPSHRPEDKERAEYQRNRAAAATRAAELQALIEERRRNGVDRRDLSKPQTATQPRPYRMPESKPVSTELMEVEAQIEVYETKLKRTKKPLSWTRRKAMEQRVAELKATRQLLKAKP
jgi:hypothetical protein